MGVDARKPMLPAPTDSSTLESSGGSLTPTDLATDLSRRTDKTSHTVPDDGRPITIPTGEKRSKSKKNRLSKSHNHSQTSLLIEYFEGGKVQGVTKRPSVRVKVSPSTKRKAGEKGGDEVVVTQGRGSRKPSYHRRISLGTDSPKQTVEAGSISSISSLSEESRLAHRRAPIEVEVAQGSDLSQNSTSEAARFLVPASDVSSMPPDSMLEGNGPQATARPARSGTSSRDNVVDHEKSRTPNRRQSRSVSKDDTVKQENLRTPTRRRSRSLSRERLTQKILEKLANKPRDVPVSHQKRHREKGRSRSNSKDVSEADASSLARRSSRQHEHGSLTTGTESSFQTDPSAAASHRKSGDQMSFISGTSKSSVNNPKLLDAFEDVLRRVIIPELKELKKDKKVSGTRNKYEAMMSQSDTSTSSIPQDQGRRRVSRHDGGPDSKAQTTSTKASGDSRRRERRRNEVELDSPSEPSSRRRESGGSYSLDEDQNKRRRHKDPGLRHAAAGALASGALTAAALHHHDSRSNVDRRERRRKHSNSRSRSASIAESEEIFEKHGVPPMPMRSDLETEMTRSSLLSDDTASTPVRREVRQVPQGSPREVLSPASTATGSPISAIPRKAPGNQRQGLGTHHGNLSHRDLSSYARDSHDDQVSPHRDAGQVGAPEVPTSAPAGSFLADEDRQRRYEANLHHQHPIRRGLSPIQSVASYNPSEPNRTSMMHARSSNSLTTLSKEQQGQRKASVESLSSAPSPNLSRSKRPEGINLETQSEILGPYEDRSRKGSRDMDADAFFDEQQTENQRYRDSYASRDSYAGSDSKLNHRRLTSFTDDSDLMNSGQQVTHGHGTNPTYVNAPADVESAVASLYDPSVQSARSGHSTVSQPDSIDRQKLANKRSANRALHVRDSGSPLKQEYGHGDRSFQQRTGAASPPQSVSLSEDDGGSEPHFGASGVPVASDPMPEIGVGLDSPQSEITTNPSVIHGPIGGSSSPSNREHWPYATTPPRSKGGLISPSGEDRGLGITDPSLSKGTIGAGLGALGTGKGEAGKDMPAGEYYGAAAAQDYDQNRDSYMTNPVALTPPKDEGYISAANAGTYSPDPTRNIATLGGQSAPYEGKTFQDDPFVARHGGQLEETGKGIESIQSKDIVALMDHLTVRDAQRNARDTEILVTLVRSAAEMRNSFEDMKRFITEQDDFIMDTADRQHHQTVQKVINGPRPQPLGTSRFPVRSQSEEEEIDTPGKRQNVFKRALRGLSTKNTSELQNIESMLMRLLGEVEGLRANQDGPPMTGGRQINSFNSVDNAREPTDPGYEPEGQAGTSSTGDRSGHLSTNSSRQADHRGAAAGHRESTNRVSTVMEGNEDSESDDSQDDDAMDQRYAPEEEPDQVSPADRGSRGASLPLATPPRNLVSESRAYSNENTPQLSTDSKFRGKNKSTSSSLYPKMISRWSKTTASSIVDTFRHGKARPYSEASRSGSIGHFDDYDGGTQGDALRSNNSYLDEQYDGQENRPPSPLVPSSMSENPKYHAHRNSMNLQHPQPRQGPTGRFQNHLENEAQTYEGQPFSPSSQTSSGWQQPKQQSQGNSYPQQRYSGYSGNDRLSPISDGAYSESSSAMMEMGQEEYEQATRRRRTSGNSAGSASGRRSQQGAARYDDPLVPQRPPKIPMSPGAGRSANYLDHVSAARAGSPAFDKSPVAALRSSPAASGAGRKPSGPRPQTTSGQYSPGGQQNITAKRTRFQHSPDQT